MSSNNKADELIEVPGEIVQKYHAANKKLQEIQTALELAEADRSNIVKELFFQYGKGPYNFNNQALIVIKRGETYFLRAVRGTKNKAG